MSELQIEIAPLVRRLTLEDLTLREMFIAENDVSAPNPPIYILSASQSRAPQDHVTVISLGNAIIANLPLRTIVRRVSGTLHVELEG